MHYYKFNIPDWTLHTAHLSPEEEGIYLRLVNFYYDTETAIPLGTQSVIRRLRLGGYEEIVKVLLEEYFYLDGEEWHHKRCDSEVEVYQAMADKNRRNASKGGRPKGNPSKPKTNKNPVASQSVNSGIPNISLTKNQEPGTNNQEGKEKRKRFVPPTLDEVIQRCQEMHYQHVDPTRFVSHYGSNGWRVGKNKMENWKQALAGWESRDSKQAAGKSTRDRTITQDLTDTSWAH